MVPSEEQMPNEFIRYYKDNRHVWALARFMKTHLKQSLPCLVGVHGTRRMLRTIGCKSLVHLWSSRRTNTTGQKTFKHVIIISHQFWSCTSTRSILCQLQILLSLTFFPDKVLQKSKCTTDWCQSVKVVITSYLSIITKAYVCNLFSP